MAALKRADAVAADDARAQRGFARKMGAAGVGNVLEWYDFAVFGSLADVLGDVFFSSEPSRAVRLVSAFAVFGAAFLMRPLGGVLVGHVGDRLGRKRALELSLALMLVPSVAIGCLPTFADVGLVAPIALVTLRLVQARRIGARAGDAS